MKQRGVLVTASSDHEEDDDELAVPMPTRPARRVGVVGVPKLYHDSDEDFDTDLEDDFPKKLVGKDLYCTQNHSHDHRVLALCITFVSETVLRESTNRIVHVEQRL